MRSVPCMLTQTNDLHEADESRSAMPSPGYQTVPRRAEGEKLPTLQVYGHEVKSDASRCQERTLNLGNLWISLAEMSQNGSVRLGLHDHTLSASQ